MAGIMAFGSITNDEVSAFLVSLAYVGLSFTSGKEEVWIKAGFGCAIALLLVWFGNFLVVYAEDYGKGRFQIFIGYSVRLAGWLLILWPAAIFSLKYFK
jgi:hypothetical protein